MKKSWLEPHFTSLLIDRRDTFDSWRRQVPALSGRTKNFENWLLELVDRVSRSGKIRDLRTNGHFSAKKIKASEVDGLTGSKSKAVHLSPDISIRLKTGDRIIRRKWGHPILFLSNYLQLFPERSIVPN